MGGSLSVQESAYKQLSRDLKNQGDDYIACIERFVKDFDQFDVISTAYYIIHRLVMIFSNYKQRIKMYPFYTKFLSINTRHHLF